MWMIIYYSPVCNRHLTQILGSSNIRTVLKPTACHFMELQTSTCNDTSGLYETLDFDLHSILEFLDRSLCAVNSFCSEIELISRLQICLNA